MKWRTMKCLGLTTAMAWSVLLAPSATAQEKVGSLGDPERWTVQGAHSFTPAEIRQGLTTNMSLLLAAHPAAPLDVLPAKVREGVLAGYRHAGFRDAEVNVQVRHQARQLAIDVNEGQRFTAGEVRISGGKTIDVAALKKRLTEPYAKDEVVSIVREQTPQGERTVYLDKDGKNVGQESPVWERGENIDFTPDFAPYLQKSIDRALADVGYPFAKSEFQIDVDPKTRQGVLVVQIVDEGTPGTIDKIEISGNKKNTREEVLEYLQLRPGMKWNRAEQTRIELALWQSARFIDYSVKPVKGGDVKEESTLDLGIDLKEYRHAPRLSEPFSSADTALLRYRDWLASLSQQNHDLVVQATVGGRHMEAIVGGSGGMFLFFYPSAPSQEKPAPPVRYALAVEPGGLSLLDPQRRRRLNLASSRHALVSQLQLKPSDPDADGECMLSLSINAGLNPQDAQNPGPPFQAIGRWSPAAFMVMGHRKVKRTEIKDGVLTLTGDDSTLRIDCATGKLVEYQINDVAPKASLRCFTRPGALKRAQAEVAALTQDCKQQFEADQPITSIASFLADDEFLLDLLLQMYERPELKTKAQDKLKAFGKLAQMGLLSLLDSTFKEYLQDPKTKFFIPDRAATLAAMSKMNYWRMGSIVALSRSDRYFRRGTWPWTVWRESWFVMAGEPQYTVGELNRLNAQDDCGPLFYLVTAKLSQWRNPKAAQKLAKMGLKSLTRERFRSDVQVLLDKETITGRSTIKVFDELRKLNDEETRLLGRHFLKQPEALLELIQPLRAHRDVPSDVLLPKLLDLAWETGLKDLIKEELRKLADE